MTRKRKRNAAELPVIKTVRCTTKVSEYIEGNKNDSEIEPNEILDFEGFVHEGQLYLREKSTDIVYLSTRDENSNMIEVGTWTGSSLVFTKETQCLSNISAADDYANEKALTDINFMESHVFPFKTDEDDHCETCIEAYEHIAPLLKALAKAKGKDFTKLRIYDPYYCNGRVVENLTSLGFPRVYNEKEDFYAVIEENRVPKYDILVTNPPYSADHVDRLLRFCSESSRPWLLLLPNYVYMKEIYQEISGKFFMPFYVVSEKRYRYYSPAFTRTNIKSSDRRTSPFITFWYADFGKKYSEAVLLEWNECHSNPVKCNRSWTSETDNLNKNCTLIMKLIDLPYKAMDSSDPIRKRARDKKRSRNRPANRRNRS